MGKKFSDADFLWYDLGKVGFDDITWSGKGQIKFGSYYLSTLDAIRVAEQLAGAHEALLSAIRKDLEVNGMEVGEYEYKQVKICDDDK
jgi:hypothetical protein